MRFALGVFVAVVLFAESAVADVPPEPGYVEECTVERQRKDGETCESCDTYHGESDKCVTKYKGTAFVKRCQTRGASVWDEVWCRPLTPDEKPPATEKPAAEKSSGGKVQRLMLGLGRSARWARVAWTACARWVHCGPPSSVDPRAHPTDIPKRGKPRNDTTAAVARSRPAQPGREHFRMSMANTRARSWAQAMRDGVGGPRSLAAAGMPAAVNKSIWCSRSTA